MKLFGEFAKVEAQDDGTLRVEGYASSEAVDSDGETIQASAMKAAIPDYMAFGAVREMHQPLAAGTALEMAVEDDGRTRFVAHVVDPVAVKKVKAGVYKGFSIGGKVTGRDPLAKTTITGLRLTEVSLVDRPANPAAVLTMYKADVRASDTDEVEESASTPSAPADAGQATAAESGADAAVDVAKSLSGVASLASVVQSLAWVAQDSAWEAQYEQDGSGVPARLKALAAEAAQLLGDMAKEEADEAVASIPDPIDATPTVDTVTLADTPSGDDAVAKAGKRHSSADQSMIQGMHDQSIALGASCPDCPTCGTAKVAKADGAADDLAKVTQAREAAEADRDDAIEKLGAAITERESLAKRVRDLEAQPAPGKGVVRQVVGKAMDTDDATTKVDAPDPKDPIALMKHVHATGGRPVL